MTLFSVFMLLVKALAVLGAGGRGEENRQGQDWGKMEAGSVGRDRAGLDLRKPLLVGWEGL